MKLISLVRGDQQSFTKPGGNLKTRRGPLAVNRPEKRLRYPNINETQTREMEEVHNLAPILGKFGKQKEKKKDKRVTFSEKTDIRWIDADPSAAADQSGSSIHDFDKGTKNMLRNKWKYDPSNQEAQKQDDTDAAGVVKEAEASFVSEFERFRQNSDEQNIGSNYRYLILDPKTCDEFSSVSEEEEDDSPCPEYELNHHFNAQSMFIVEDQDRVTSKSEECEAERWGAGGKSAVSKRQREAPKQEKSSPRGDVQTAKVRPEQLKDAQEQGGMDQQIKLRFYKHRVESLEQELQQQILLNKMVKKENRELQKALKRSQKSAAADLRRIDTKEKTYVETIPFTKSSPTLWARLRQFLGLRRASWKL